MLKLKRIVKEAKQVGTLYHVCNLRSAVYNLEHDCLKPSVASNSVNGKATVSFTRDRSFVVDTINSPVFFQFVIDGDTLSTRKSIHPYRDTRHLKDSETESEEVVLGEVRGLTSFTTKVNIFIIEGAIYKSLVIPDPMLYSNLMKSLEAVLKYNLSNEVHVVQSYENLNRVQSSVPKQVKDLLPLIKQFVSYDNISAMQIIKSMLPQASFSSSGIFRRDFDISSLPKLSTHSKEILKIVTTLQDNLKARSLIVTEDKMDGKVIKRHSSHKLETLLSNATYKLFSITVNPIFDWLNFTSPYCSLTVMLSSGKSKTFYVYFV